MKLPGPDHPITIAANPKRVRVSADGVVIADTTQALTLKEASYPAVQYVPRTDANMELLARTDRVTHCPYKGDANYFSINANGKTLENAIWTYETPFPAMAEITGHLAFYPDRVKIEELDQEDHDEDIEQEAGDIGRCGRYAGEAENAGNDRDQEEQQRPSQNCHRQLLKPCDPLGGISCEIADLTFEQGNWFRQRATDGRRFVHPH